MFFSLYPSESEISRFRLTTWGILQCENLMSCCGISWRENTKKYTLQRYVAPISANIAIEVVPFQPGGYKIYKP